MCGISGVVAKNSGFDPRPDVERMNALVRHRGPDGEGVACWSNLAIGHRRLAIVDITPSGHQPMERDNRFWITFNGEIYNFLELRKELQALGETFRSETDTEVILAAYKHWGVHCVDRFNGMWAFAIYDHVSQCLFFARDRFGVKPLYFVDRPDRFAFGSEIKQLLTQLPSVRANREQMLESLLTNYDGHTSETYFAEVNSFPPGHRAVYDLRTHRLRLEPWYQVRADPDARNLRGVEAAECFKTVFQDAVRLRLRADVRVGTCLSGGLDSSSISAVASRMYNAVGGARFLAVHAKSTDAETDESIHACRAADALGIELHTVEPDESNFLATIDELAWTQEEPFASGSMFMGWHVFQRAKALGCPVMLNGQGGDEALLGYERYFAALLSSLPLHRWPREFRMIARNNSLTRLQLLQNSAYFLYPQLRVAWLKSRSFLRNEFKHTHNFSTVQKSGRSMRDVVEMQKLDIRSLQLPTLLRYEDRNSMRHSIETRLPFLDYRVVEFSLGLPIDAKLRDGWTKHVLRSAMSDYLPADIAWRRDKLGFEAPMRTWLAAAGSLMFSAVAASPLLAEITDHKRLLKRFPTLPLRERWRYFNVATWERVFGVIW